MDRALCALAIPKLLLSGEMSHDLYFSYRKVTTTVTTMFSCEFCGQNAPRCSRIFSDRLPRSILIAANSLYTPHRKSKSNKSKSNNSLSLPCRLSDKWFFLRQRRLRSTIIFHDDDKAPSSLLELSICVPCDNIVVAGCR